MDVRLGDTRIKSIYKGETPIPGIQIGSQLWHGSEGHIISSGVDIGKVWYNGVTSGNETVVVSSGGKWYNLSVIDNWHDHVSVESGGEVDHTTITSLGHVYVSSGGRAYNTSLYANGYLYISNGGIASNAELIGLSLSCIHVRNGGKLYNATARSVEHIVSQWHSNIHVSYGGVASGLIIESNAQLVISSGGTALAVTSRTGAEITVSFGGYIEYT